MKKVLMVAFMAVLASASVHAFPMIEEGVRELEFNFYFIDGDYELGLGYGKYITDNVLLGGRLQHISWSDVFILGGRLEYNWNMGTKTVRYASFLISYMDFSIDSLFVYGPAFGVKHFITGSTAIDISAQYLLSSESYWQEKLELRGGLRVLF